MALLLAVSVASNLKASVQIQILTVERVGRSQVASESAVCSLPSPTPSQTPPPPRPKHFPELPQPLLCAARGSLRSEILGGRWGEQKDQCQKPACLGLNPLLLQSGRLFNLPESQLCHL